MTFYDTIIIGHPILDRAPEEYEMPVYIFEKYAISAYPREESRERIFSWQT
jgi:hypothetical protein